MLEQILQFVGNVICVVIIIWFFLTKQFIFRPQFCCFEYLVLFSRISHENDTNWNVNKIISFD